MSSHEPPVEAAPGVTSAAAPKAPAAPVRRTPLYERHVALGAKMVPFAGFSMPLQYSGILDEHRAVREAVGLFDVSHMGEIVFAGPEARAAVQRLVTNDVGRLEVDTGFYTCTLREDGGIVDDLIVSRIGPARFLAVVNASNVEKDYAHFLRHVGPTSRSTCEVQDLSPHVALLALQGPRAIALLAEVAGEKAVPPRPFTLTEATIGRSRVHISRTGYTGEDGVEIFVNADEGDAGEVWDALMDRGRTSGIKPIGLGARDTLRLEARLCLYGNDIDEQHDPIEAGLGWVCKGAGFVGEEAVRRARSEGVARRLVGWKALDRGTPRHGYTLHAGAPALDSLGGERVGEVTSGSVAPTVGGSIGMAWVDARFAEPGTRLVADCRSKPVAVEIVKGPFYTRAKP